MLDSFRLKIELSIDVPVTKTGRSWKWAEDWVEKITQRRRERREYFVIQLRVHSASA